MNKYKIQIYKNTEIVPLLSPTYCERWLSGSGGSGDGEEGKCRELHF